MKNNDVLRRLRYALDLNDAAVVDIFRLSGPEVTLAEVADLLRKEEDPGYRPCNDTLMARFLNGLITYKRGPGPDGAVRPPEKSITNNDILKKLRVALNLKEEDMMSIFKLAGYEISKSELTAFFRKDGNKHFIPCGDQILRNFLKGLSLRFRGLRN
ncbi:MAG TPA: DUF1456 family protein [Spirochaetota bacterium]|nr:DUF1456 family protein [Spirochaetota bacterium]